MQLSNGSLCHRHLYAFHSFNTCTCICHNGQLSLTSPIHRLATSLPDVAFTCRRQLHSLNNSLSTSSVHSHLFCRDAALCTVSCLRLPQPVCTSPLPSLTQHLLRHCSPAIRPRKLSAYYSPHLHLSHRLIRTQSATRLRLHRPRVGALWTRADASPFF